MATTSPIFQLPAPELTDGANIESAVGPLRDRLEVVLNALIPVGFIAWDAGSALPTLAGWVWDYADGGLIDRTTYLGFFNRVGHAHNGGIDPGANKVRKPDKRGRGIVGADTFPASPISGAAGAAGRLTTAAGHSNARGQTGGEERHTLAVGEVPALRIAAVPQTPQNDTGFGFARLAPGGAFGTTLGNLMTEGGGGAHNVLGPYQAEYALVRIA